MSEARNAAIAAMAELGLTVEAEFVPLSRSRNKAEKHPSLNWRVTLKRNGRDVLTTDYMAGSGHCPADKRKEYGSGKTVFRSEAIALECEHGKETRLFMGNVSNMGGKPITPDPVDVLYSLISDSDVLNHSSFESWASEFGFDTDSRKAEGIYQACLAIALQLRNAIGETGLQQLQAAFQDY